MSEPIFCRTRHHYDSYTDYWRLVELSGFATCYVDEMELEDPDKTYIISPMNGEFHSHIDWEREKNCEIFHWNLERPGGATVPDFIHNNQWMMSAGRVDLTIVSDLELAEQTGFHYVPLGSHPGLGTPGDVSKEYDFIHLMCYSLRRAELFNYLTPHENWRGFHIAPNGWGEERHRRLQRTKFMLNMHQDDWMFLEPLRFALAATYRLPIVTEELYDPFPYDPLYLVQFGVDSRLVNMTRRMQWALDNYTRLQSYGDHIYYRMTGEFSFRNCLRRYL